MKKKLLFAKGAKRWNNLLAKFTKLQKRVELLSSNINTSLYKKLVSKMENIFSKLEKMQYQTGIKLAGTSLAVVLSAFTANAQFAAGEQLETPKVLYVSGQQSSTFADIDGDGDKDMYVGNGNGSILVYENNNGIYTQLGPVGASSVAVDVGSNAMPVFADIDGDGDLDLYVGNQQGTIEVFTNTGGTFSISSSLQDGAGVIDPGLNSAPAFADIDGDGDLDLYVGYRSLANDGEIRLYTNSGGTFTSAGVMALTGPPPNTAFGFYPTPAFNDADGDGDLDLYAGSLNGLITLWTNNGGAFTFQERIESNNVVINPGTSSHPSFNDADGDGDNDLYINVNILYTNDAGSWVNPEDVTVPDILNGGDNAAPTFADMDADGDLDLYIGNHSGEIKVFTNNNGTFVDGGSLQAGTTIDVGEYATPTFADVDNDGDLDLYVGGYDGSVKFFSNNNGLFTAGTDLVSAGANWDDYYTAPAFADIDADGDLDLYSGQYYGEVSTFTNNSGVFTVGSDLQAGGVDIDLTYRTRPTFADIDNDGDLDLYLGNGYGEISVYINTNGVFAAATNLQAAGVDITVGGYAAPTFADVDGDGDLDLYVGNGAGEITFYENTSMTAILVSSIAVQGAGGASTITTQGGTLQMSATVLPANADDGTYFWSIVNQTGTASISANGILTAITDGVVSVRATANDGSGVTGAKSITISNQTVGIDEINSQNISIYPNPVNNKLFVEVENQQVTNMVIIDYSGRVVKSIANNNTNSIDVSGLTQGVYILKIATKEGVSTNRFIKK